MMMGNPKKTRTRIGLKLDTSPPVWGVGMHDRIKRYVDEHLRVRLHLPDGVKAPRLDSKNVSPYAGGSSVAEFWTWLKSLVVYLETSQLGGLDRDCEQKLLVEPVLTGAAKKWYHDHVIEVDKYLNWMFVSIIIGLYNQFIHDSAMQEARTKFDSASFTDGGGTVEGYRDLLQTLVHDMTRKPDDYTITRQFVTGLPTDMRDAVFEDRLNVEVNTLDDFVESAKAYKHPNDVTRARPPKPSDMSHVKCYHCGEMGHYASHHDKDNNPRIQAAHTTIGDDVREGMNDNDSMVENGPSDIEDGYEQANWQEVEFEEYGGKYDSGDDNEFMGMARECDGSIDPYDGSDESSSGYDKEYSSSDEIEHIRYQTWTLPVQITSTSSVSHAIQGNGWYKLKIATEPKERPVYSATDKMCLSTYTQVNGILVLTLWDSGSTLTAMSPHFADVSKALVFNLVDPVMLQLGTVGSRSKINFRTIADMELAGLTTNEYVDVVNIDRTAIEVLDGGETGKTVNPLPKDSPALLMTEEEYIIGDRVDITPTMEPHSVPTKVSALTPNDENTQDSNSRKVEAPTSTVHDTTMEYECQPTSSKVLVEDMIMDEDDDTHEHHFHIDIDFSNQTPHEVWFWDCPVPIPKVKWPGDSHMPTEWNLMVGEMWEIDPTSQGSLFNYPDFPYSDDPETDINDHLSFIVPNLELESEGPYEFTSDMYPDD
ncbi:hypothetical protein EDD18DRAFT_1111371 [Armillaria luteobubalina]|uniref:CCHC-type domain-containing protein n=1 Tax=Armillaria luteobubalina TaxID=153913 RepID=A0AA39PKV1_9AGAR|nr:hypothetical protein EDD18DRAFT_1111371 [Armillaria luteobubalina]